MSIHMSQIRYVQNPGQCTQGYVVTVNKQGQPGDQRPQGPPGTPGVSDFVVRSADPVDIGAFDSGSSTASCMDGEVAVGGGYIAVPYYDVMVRVNTRWNDDAWFVEVLNGVNDDIQLHVDVTCAQP